MKRAEFQISAREQQMRQEAIDPGLSVFLTANAGSGKTTILTNRVIRLLLSGAPPARILCLTYTKAAAAEMQDRIFKTLGGWVRMSDADLSAAIRQATGVKARASDLPRARALFAGAVETPGGLKIQTIHAFAERLLHLFPFEANVPARFQVMDDLGKAELLEHARRAVIRDAMAAPDSDCGRAFATLADSVAEDTFSTLMSAALPLLRKTTSGARTAQDWRSLMAGALDLEPGETEEQIAHGVLDCGFPPALWQEAMAAVARAPTSMNTHFVEKLTQCDAARGAIARAEGLIDLFTTLKGTIRDKMVSANVLAANPWLAEAIEQTAAALPQHIDRLKRIRTLERSVALMTVAAEILRRYRADKAARALVDFDDMIDKALALVTRQDGSSWVLMKLDGGIDHILIDEAQDTTPEMWEIVRALTNEFFAGEGARAGQRTVFAVGDEKQSIYSFQGARPEAFAGTRRHFAQTIPEADRAFRQHELKLSFRTVLDVLKAVDAVFSQTRRFDGLSSDNTATVHETARGSAPGAVDLWPLEKPPAKQEPDAWAEVDALAQGSAQVRLAERLADDIARLVQFETFEGDARKIGAGDIMILVQRRDAFFEAVIRALKRRNVPVAGADRVRLTEEIAVMDLVAAARAALLPEDDLALAEALKSPLVGLSDDDLIKLAPMRAGSLHAALAADAAYAGALAIVERWRSLAQRVTPYEFFATILGPMDGRRRLLARLGPDAADGIELFLAGVLNRETRDPPSLVNEIAAFSTLTTDIKRDQEQAGEAVRVLTVHGAKGLEARIVYLPDCNRLPLMKDGALFAFDAPPDEDARVLLWSSRKEERPSVIAARRAEDERLKMQEYRRLFYVAMTRAKDRLIIAGWGDPDKLKPECWYAMAEAAFAENAPYVHESERGDGACLRRWRVSNAGVADDIAPQMPLPPPVPPLPSWLRHKVAPEPQSLPPLRPSRALDAADQRVLPEREAARMRGDLIHLLLERLPSVPADKRASAAATLLAERAPRMDEGDRARVTTRVLALIADPAHAALFGPQSRGEVAISGEIPLPNGAKRAVLGRIDRLAEADGDVLIADFKTGHGPPRRHAVMQMALYCALLGAIYPGRTIRALLIWTDQARIEPLAPAEMEAALNSL